MSDITVVTYKNLFPMMGLRSNKHEVVRFESYIKSEPMGHFIYNLYLSKVRRGDGVVFEATEELSL